MEISWRRVRLALLAAAAACGAMLVGVSSAAAAPRGSGYYVTFVARSCPEYTDIFANKARNNILESLKDLGPDAQQYYVDGGLINPDYEEIPPQDACSPVPNWQFTIGTGYQSRAVTGPWGSLSIVTGPYDTPIVTQDSTPLLNQNAQQIDNETLAGATTIELTDAQRQQASQPDQLWAQGGTPTDPVLATQYPGPEFGFGALRCATDDLNGDNVEYIYFPTGVTHVFCYGLYVKPSPTAGLITIKKEVSGAPQGENPSFPFTGSISYDPGGFQLSNGGSIDFYRAGGVTWNVTEGPVDNYKLSSVQCSVVAEGGVPPKSTTSVTGATTSITLVAGEHVTCVYSNTYVPPTGGLTIRKITKGGVGSFRYLISPVSGGQSNRAQATTTEPNVPVDAEPSPLSLAPGTYEIRERPSTSPDGSWRLVAANCNGARRATGQPVEVTIQSGAASTCTFVNAFIPRGSIALAKVTHNATGTVSFLISPSSGPPAQYIQHATTTAEGVPADAKPDTAADATDHLRLGPYTIIEQSPPSAEPRQWALAGVLCNGISEPFDEGTIDVRLTRSQPHLNCTFSDVFTSRPPPIPPPIPPTPPTPPPAPVYSLADLVVSKQTSASVVLLGQVVRYRITVKNLGPDPAERVWVTDQPLGHATIVSIRSSSGICLTSPRAMCALGTLAPGTKATVIVELSPTAETSKLVNLAVAGTATAERTLANNVSHATVTVGPPPPGRG